MENKNILLEFAKRSKQLYEFVVPSNFVDEADNDQQQDDNAGAPDDMGGIDDDIPQDNGAQMGDSQNMGGGEQPPMGDANPMGGDAQGGAPMDGGMQQDQIGGGQTPQGFNPQDNGMQGDPMSGSEVATVTGEEGEQIRDTMQPDDEVVDITDLTDAQEDMSDDIKKVGNKFDKLLKTIGKLEAMLQSNDEKINSLTSEFEKRNPTNIEKLGNQVTKSYPYSVKPEEYWADKTENSNYSTEDDNNGKGNEVYSITNADVNDNNWNEIAKSFDDEDSFMYNQTLNNLLRIR